MLTQGNIDKITKKGLQATFKQIYAVFCNVLPILVDILTKSSLQPKYEFISCVYWFQKPAKNPIRNNYAHPVSGKRQVLSGKKQVTIIVD